MPRKKKADLPRLRYGIIYLFDARVGWSMQNVAAHGTCETLANAVGNAAKHVERSLLLDHEYGKAVVWDRHEMRVVYVYSRSAQGMLRKDYSNEFMPIGGREKK